LQYQEVSEENNAASSGSLLIEGTPLVERYWLTMDMVSLTIPGTHDAAGDYFTGC